MPAKLGIIAGGGNWPLVLAKAGQEQGREVFLLALIDNADEAAVGGLPHEWIGMGSVGKAISLLKRERCQDVVMAGPITRPSLGSLKVDWRGAKLLPKVLKAKGDDEILSLLLAELESEGFRPVGADDIIAGLLAPRGAVGSLSPDAGQDTDIARGVEVAGALGLLDVGQAVVVQQGFVLGVEGAEGTNALVMRCRDLQREGPGGVLVKITKPGQDRRVDLPTIGLETVKSAAAAGLSGIAVEAGGALIADREAVARAADDAGLFVIGVDVPADG